jgi:hypothetical protein
VLKPSFLLVALTLAACGRSGDAAPAQSDRRALVAPPDTMSTAMKRALDQFRTTVTGPAPRTIQGGAQSRDQLVRNFVAAVQRADTSALIRMTMNRAEFAYLYYPNSIYTHPPYELDPETAWMLSRANSEKGLTRIIQRFAGKDLQMSGYQCAETPRHEGPNRYWDECTLSLQATGVPATMRWFGGIWDRDGQFKFLSYANDF